MSDGAGMRAATDTVVTIEYRASLTNGDLVDSTDHCGPVTYLHGNEQIFPALEQAVDGLTAGEERVCRCRRRRATAQHRPSSSDACRGPSCLPSWPSRSASATRSGRRAAELKFRLVGSRGTRCWRTSTIPPRGRAQIWARVVAVRPATAEEIRRGRCDEA